MNKTTTKFYTRYQDVPQMIQSGSWECDFDLFGVWEFVVEQQKEGGLDINPDFQRAHVWTQPQQRAWLEFFLRGGKTGRIFYFNKPSWNNTAKTPYDEFVIVDGKQRLEAIRRFVTNEIRVFGSLCSEYQDNPRRVNHTIKININDLSTRADVIFWYLQFNEGGTPHTQEELDRVRVLLKQESGSKPWICQK